jgi:hypothetical protein
LVSHVGKSLLFLSFFLSLGLPAQAWDPIMDLTGKNLTNLVRDRGENLVRATGKFLRNPIKYTLQLPRSVLADICGADAKLYEGTLEGKASGHWKTLPSTLVEVFQPYYSVDLTRVRYATVSIPTGNAMTFGDSIYFPKAIDLRTSSDVWWMAHELEHVVQYAGANSQAEKLCEYQLKYLTSAGHNTEFEKAADRKANTVADIGYTAMNVGTADFTRRGMPVANADGSGIPIAALGIKPVTRFPTEPPNSVWISNETNQPVYFGLRTQRFWGWGGQFLPPHGRRVYFGAPQDRDFQISVITDGYEVLYVIPTQSAQRIAWNRFGILDVFYD